MIKWLILFGITSLLSERPEEFTVVAESGLNLRVENSIDSPVLEKLPFGSIITSNFSHVLNLEKEYVKDTIGGIIGYWVDAKYQKENVDIEGYVFSPYISRGILDLKNGAEKPFRITYEGLSCTELDYYPGLNWYGFYENEDGFEIRPIEVELLLGKWNEEKLIIEYQMVEDMSIIIETSDEERSKFLIGVSDSIKLVEGNLLTLYKSKNMGYTKDERNGFLSIGEEVSLNYMGTNCRFEGIQRIDKKDNNQISRTYDILISNRNDTQEFGQYLSGSILLTNTPDAHEYFQTPQVRWIGELNGDGYLDFIIYQHTMKEGCGVCWTRTLFLGHETNLGLATYQKIDEAEECNCDL